MTLRVEFPHRGGTLGAILTAVGEAGGMVGAVDIVRMREDRSIRDITVSASDSEHGRRIVETVEALPETHVINISDRTFLDRKSTRLNSSHANISYAVFCLKKKKNKQK